MQMTKECSFSDLYPALHLMPKDWIDPGDPIQYCSETTHVSTQGTWYSAVVLTEQKLL